MLLITLLLTLLFLAVAVAVGVAVNLRRGRDHADDDTEGASVLNVLEATALLAGLLVAIVLSDASGSYSEARSAAKSEADTVDSLYESAEYVDLPARQAIQAAVVCYARAVAGPEWDAMDNGESSRVPNNWTGTGPFGIRRALIDITPEAQGFDLVQPGDQARGELRSDRLTQARPTVPAILYWFMVLLVGLSLAGLAYSIPRQKNRAQIAALSVVTVLFGLVLFLISNFDRPYSGVLRLKPSAMRIVEQDVSEDYAEAYNTALPCDAEGRPLESAVAIPATTTTTASPTTTIRTTTTIRR
jgi:hypothetical protein